MWVNATWPGFKELGCLLGLSARIKVRWLWGQALERAVLSRAYG